MARDKKVVVGVFYPAGTHTPRKTIVTSAQGMSAGTAKTPKAVEGEARQPGPKDAPKPSPGIPGDPHVR